MQLLTLKGDVSSTNVIMEHVHCNSHSGEAINSNNGAYLRPHMGKDKPGLPSECAPLKGNLGLLARILLPVTILS